MKHGIESGLYILKNQNEKNAVLEIYIDIFIELSMIIISLN